VCEPLYLYLRCSLSIENMIMTINGKDYIIKNRHITSCHLMLCHLIFYFTVISSINIPTVDNFIPKYLPHKW
jgi:hypothetical protein